MSDPAILRARIAVSAGAAGAAGAIAYVGQRLWEHTRGQGADPALVLYDPRIAFHGRTLAATWWAGVALAIVMVITRDERGRARVAKLLERGAIPLVIALAVATYLWP